MITKDKKPLTRSDRDKFLVDYIYRLKEKQRSIAEHKKYLDGLKKKIV